jgi:hypothetical protein
MRQKTFSEEAVNRKQRSRDIDLEDTNGEKETPVVVEANPTEVPFSLSQFFDQLLSLDCGQNSGQLIMTALRV